jgi:ketosteroid isomerase-like protein
MPEAWTSKLVWIGALLILQGCDGPGAERHDRSVATQNGPSPSMSAQGADSAAPSIASDQKQLVALEYAYSQALIRRDRAFLESYYAADWRGGNWMGFWTKATMLKAVLGDRYLTKEVTLTNVRARVVGDIGIVQGVSQEVTSVDGRDTSGRWSFTDVFRKDDGQWKAIASHTSEVKAE